MSAISGSCISMHSLRKTITGLPVIANGGLHDVNVSGHVLETKQAGLLAIGKAALADPSWPLKMQQHRPVISFVPEFIKLSAGIEHTNSMRSLVKDLG